MQFALHLPALGSRSPSALTSVCNSFFLPVACALSDRSCCRSPSALIFCALHSFLMHSIANFFLSVQLIGSVLLALPGRRVAGGCSELLLAARVMTSTSCLLVVFGISILEASDVKLTMTEESET